MPIEFITPCDLAPLRSAIESNAARLAEIERRLDAMEPTPEPEPEPEPTPEPEPEPAPIGNTYAGAEGYARNAVGGRVDGTVTLVVNRYDDPLFTREDMLANQYTPGTLRWAMYYEGPKLIKFADPCVIRLIAPIQPLKIEAAANFTFNETRQPVTVIGEVRMQVCGESVWLNSRFRAALWNNGYRPLPFQGSPQASGDSLHIENPTGKTLVMNCEFSGSADELFNVKYAQNDVTIQDCLFYEAFKNGDFGKVWGDEGGHNYGALLTAKNEGTFGLSFIRNGYLNLGKRCPTEVYSLPTNPRFKRLVMVNCLCYNWRNPCGSFEGTDPTVMAGCHFETGPSTVVSALGYMTNGYIVDSVIKTPAGEFDRANTTTATNPYFIRNFSTGAFSTVLGTSLPAELAEEISVTPMPRLEGINHVLNNAGVFPLDNVSRANRDSFINKTGWQGAHPNYASGDLEAYLTWATGVAS